MIDKSYDFVLFESTRARNHHKDLEMIAHMLVDGGLNVAIAEVYMEAERCTDPSIPHISFEKRFEDKFLLVEDCCNPIKRFIKNRIVMHRYGNYLKYVAQQLNHLTKNIYAGSQENIHPFSWIKKVDKDINIYLWGLRSYRMYEYKVVPFTLPGIQSMFNKKYYWYPNVKYFVSDEMIKMEYLDLGVKEDHLILRPERTTQSVCLARTHYSQKFNLLSIGKLRPDKRIEVIIEAVKQLNNEDLCYTIAGKTSDRDAYEPIIQSAICGSRNVIRKNYRLSENEFNKLIEDSDFLVMCDVQQASNVTNGTMNEALLKGIPIIAPDYNPYKYYVEKYGIGLLFNPLDKESLIRAINKAKELGTTFFSDKITCYQQTLLYDSVRAQFIKELKEKNTL